MRCHPLFLPFPDVKAQGLAHVKQLAAEGQQRGMQEGEFAAKLFV